MLFCFDNTFVISDSSVFDFHGSNPRIEIFSRKEYGIQSVFHNTEFFKSDSEDFSDEDVFVSNLELPYLKQVVASSSRATLVPY
jgi:hypothetical protein